MKILAIGDPHGNLEKIKKIPIKGVDLILITGDLGKADIARQRNTKNIKREKEGLPKLEWGAEGMKKSYMEIYNSTFNILRYLYKFSPIYSIIGNVAPSMVYDSNVRKEEKKYGIKLPSFRQEMNKMKNFHLVRNKLRNFNGIKIGFLEAFWDSCWAKEFNLKNRKKIISMRKETEKAKKILNNFGKVDILICHWPPFGYLDLVNSKKGPEERNGKHAGSKVILEYIRKYQPKYVFCGHIHEGEGKAKIGRTEVYNLGVAGHKIIDI